MSEIEVQVRYDKRFGSYVAVAPSLHYCTGLGRTPEEARERLELARRLWFDSEGRPKCGPRCGGEPPRP